MVHWLWLASWVLINGVLIGCVPMSRTSTPSSINFFGEWQSLCFPSSKLDSSHMDQYKIEDKNITWTKTGYRGANCTGEKVYQYRILMTYLEPSEPKSGLDQSKIDFTYGKSFFTPHSESGIEIGRDIDPSKTWVLNHELEFENSNFKVGKVDYDIMAVTADSLCLGDRDDAHDKSNPENRPVLLSKICLARVLPPQL